MFFVFINWRPYFGVAEAFCFPITATIFWCSGGILLPHHGTSYFLIVTTQTFIWPKRSYSFTTYYVIWKMAKIKLAFTEFYFFLSEIIFIFIFVWVKIIKKQKFMKFIWAPPKKNWLLSSTFQGHGWIFSLTFFCVFSEIIKFQFILRHWQHINLWCLENFIHDF